MLFPSPEYCDGALPVKATVCSLLEIGMIVTFCVTDTRYVTQKAKKITVTNVRSNVRRSGHWRQVVLH